MYNESQQVFIGIIIIDSTESTTFSKHNFNVWVFHKVFFTLFVPWCFSFMYICSYVRIVLLMLNACVGMQIDATTKTCTITTCIILNCCSRSVVSYTCMCYTYNVYTCLLKRRARNLYLYE